MVDSISLFFSADPVYPMSSIHAHGPKSEEYKSTAERRVILV
jgi:hypothetical protein